MSETVRVEVAESIATITLNRPTSATRSTSRCASRCSMR
jgi:enoyl-CoA hydratase/carnithine racemase